MNKNQKLYREIHFNVESDNPNTPLNIDVENRTVTLSFSSDTPIEREFGLEVLSHDRDAMIKERILTSGPLLVNHNPDDVVGVIEDIWLKGNKWFAKARFSRSVRAEEIFYDVIDGIRKTVSFGYIVKQIERMKDTDPVKYLVSEWEPFEISLVSIPADINVGTDRSLNDERSDMDHDEKIREQDAEVVEETDTVEVLDEALAEYTCPECDHVFESADEPEECPECGYKFEDESEDAVEDEPVEELEIIAEEVKEQVQLKSTEDTSKRDDQKRIKALYDAADKAKVLCEDAETLVRDFVTDGKSLDEFNAEIIKRANKAEPISTVEVETNMENKDMKRYSLLRAIQAMITGDYANAQFELEVSDKLAAQAGTEARGMYIPKTALLRATSTTTTMDDLVETEVYGDEFIHALQDASIAAKLGVRFIPNLVGNQSFPKMGTGSSFGWIAEDGSAVETTLSTDSVTLSPKTIGGSVALSRKILKQSVNPGVENIVREDIMRGLAAALDSGIFNGTGAADNQPLGILNQDIDIVALGTNGDALAWGDIVDLESAVTADNVDGAAFAYATNSKVVGAMKQTAKDQGSGAYLMADGETNGYGVAVSNHIPSDGTKGTGTALSTMVFGDFNDVLVGMWGGVDIQVDPYTNGASGGLILNVFQDVDVAIRNDESFAKIVDIVT